MNKIIFLLVIAGLLLLLAVLIIIPITNQSDILQTENDAHDQSTNQTKILPTRSDTPNQPTAFSHSVVFIPFIPGYFPEDFDITFQSGTVDTGKNTFSETYASETKFFKIMQGWAEDSPPVIPDSDLTIQNHPASLTNQVDLNPLLGDDLDLDQYDTSEVWALTVVMNDVNVRVVSNWPRGEVIRFANELIPQYCFVPGYFPEDFLTVIEGAGYGGVPKNYTHSELYASNTHFYKIIQSQGEDASLEISDPNLTIQNNPASVTSQVDLETEVGYDLDLSEYDTSEVWSLSVVMNGFYVQVISNGPREEVIHFAEGLIPQTCSSTP